MIVEILFKLLDLIAFILSGILIFQNYTKAKVTLTKLVFIILGVSLLTHALIHLIFLRHISFNYDLYIFILSVIVMRFYLFNEMLKEQGVYKEKQDNHTLFIYYFIPVPVHFLMIKMTPETRPLFFRFIASLIAMAMVACFVIIFRGNIYSGPAWVAMLIYIGLWIYLLKTHRKNVDDEVRMSYFNITSVFMGLIIFRHILYFIAS